jgi:hypothetical protein
MTQYILWQAQVCKVRKAMLLYIQNGYEKSLVPSLLEKNVTIRSNVYQSIIYISEQLEGRMRLIQNDLVELLVEKLKSEEVESIYCQILEILKNLLDGEGATARALKTDTISIMLKGIKHNNYEIRILSLQILLSVAADDTGKNAERDAGCTLAICELLSDPMELAREYCLACLASLSQTKKSKKQVNSFSIY